jgi:hypothetical protein
LVHVKKVPLSLASDLGEPETLGALLDGFQQIVSQLVVGLKKHVILKSIPVVSHYSGTIPVCQKEKRYRKNIDILVRIRIQIL